MMAVSPFAAQVQAAGVLVEVGSPADQFVDPGRRLADDHLDHLAGSHRFAAGRERVGDVVLEAIFRIHDAGDAPLRVRRCSIA